MTYGVAKSPFGMLLLAGSEDELSWLSFVNKSSEAKAQLKSAFPDYSYSQDNPWSQHIVDQWINHSKSPQLKAEGTVFQEIVWNELLKSSHGATLSYSELAHRLGKPNAVRAVASAVARNPISIFIPCHRILPKSGGIGNYRWGSEKKEALLRWERNR